MKRTPMKRTAPLVRASAPAKAEIKPKKCKACRAEFFPARPLQCACSPKCAQAYAEKISAGKAKQLRRDDAREHKEALKAIKPLSYWEKRAEKAVNRYVRARDHRYGCISCHLPANWDGQWHASHLRSVAAASAVRYHLWNIHKACWICNKLYSGRIDAYRPQAEARIGVDKVAWLFTQNQVVRHDREYLDRLARVFNKKAARQERRHGM